MPKGFLLAALLAILPAAARAEVAVPDTPAGRALIAWLDAINSPDRSRQQSFLEAYPSWMNLDGLADWSAGTGGYELLEAYSDHPTNIFFHVKQRRWNVEEGGRLQLGATVPASLEVLGLWRMPAGAKFAPVTLDGAARARVLESAAAAFDTSYVDAAIGRKMATVLRKHASRGDYRDVRYGDDFASRLTRELQEISGDKHVEVRFSYFLRPAEPAAKQTAAEARRLAGINCGFEKAEHLPPNIGYLKFNMFADPAICASTASAAMTFLADSEALVIDLRDNRGGNPQMALFVVSYLFDGRTHLDDVIRRAGNTTTSVWTLPDVPGRKFIDKPVFVLTSKGTFSAAEAVSYQLKSHKRATVIGETTAGGGHLTDTRVVDDHFSVRVPTARSVSPVTKTSWQGTGVEPDVNVPADQALEVALKRAAEQIRGK